MTINNAVLTPVTPEIVVRMSIDEKIEHGPHILEAKAHFEEGDYTSPGPHATGFLTVFKAENANEESYNLHGHQQKWPSFWTYSVVMLALFYSAVGGWVSLSLSPFYLVLATEWNKDISSIAWLTSALVLVLGFANFVTVPVAVCFGRRQSYFWSSVITLGSCIWAALAKRYGSFLGARILMGAGTAGIETLAPMTIVDILPRERRGTWNSIYFYMLFGGCNLGAIVSGIIADSPLGWRWFFWITCIITGVLCVGIFFLMPETIQLSLQHNQRQHQPTNRPSKTTFSLRPHRLNPQITFTKALLRPFHVLLSPITVYSSFMFGLFCCMFLVTQVAQAQIFTINYGFDVKQTSLTNIAFLVGQLIGIAFSGILADALLARALRKHGRWEPEMRLPALVPSGALIVIALPLIGVAIARKWSWGVVVFGIGLEGCGIVAVVSVAVTYAIDSHKAYAGEFMLMSTIIKNTASFGFAYFANDWFMTQGFEKPFFILMGVALFLLLIPSVAMFIWGKKMRLWVHENGLLPSGDGILSEE